jgi:hypothetical protein
MAYNPGIQYRGDQYLYQAISNLGEKAGEAIGNYRKERAEGQFLEQEAQGLLQTGQRMAKLVDVQDPQVAEALQQNITDLGKFAGMSLAQKRAKLAQLRFDLDQFMKAAASREQGRRADEYLGLQKQNVELGQRRDAREVAAEAAQRQAGQRFVGELQQRQGVPAGRNFSLNQDRSGQPQNPEMTVDDILRAWSVGGADVDPKMVLGMLEQADPTKRLQAQAYAKQVELQNQRLQQEQQEGATGNVSLSVPNPNDPTKPLTVRVPFKALTPEQQDYVNRAFSGQQAKPAAGTVDPLTDPDVLREVVRQLTVKKAGGTKAAKVNAATGEVLDPGWFQNDTDIDELIRAFSARLQAAEGFNAGRGAAPAAPGASVAVVAPGGRRTNAAGIKITKLPPRP